MKIVKKDQQVPNHKDEKTYVVDIKNLNQARSMV